MSDHYWVIQAEKKTEIKVKGSRFIGETILVSDAESALSRLGQIRKREHSATHHCWAYRYGLDKSEESRYSDDGEPSGTAGKPIADAISGHGVTNCLVVVTRYFGGTQLGTGGLARAYAECARDVLIQSGKIERFVLSRVAVTVDVSFYDPISRLAGKIGAKQISADFSETVAIVYELRQSLAQSFIAAITDTTSGRAIATELQEGIPDA
ncbi:MAG: YigZ family protein [Candidatus Zixiibacteriota bacterium]